jgi:hypothetical protein
MCKTDLPVVDQLGLPEGPRDFCVSRGIMWPPVFTSLSHLRALPNGSELLNDVDNLTFILAEVAVNPRLVEEMALAAQRESAAATSAVYNNRRQPSRGASIGGGEDGSGADQSLSHSNNGGVSFLRTLKRATVVAALTVAAVKVGAVLWRKYEVAERFPLARRVQDSVQSVAQSAKEWLMLAAAGAPSSSSSSSSTSTERPALVQLATSGTNNAENVAVAAAGATAAIAATLTTSSNNSSAPLQPHSNPNTASSSSSSAQATTKANGGGRQSVVVVSTVTPAQRRQEESDLLFHMDRLTNFAADQPRPAPEHYKTLKGAHAKRSWARHGEWQ